MVPAPTKTSSGPGIGKASKRSTKRAAPVASYSAVDEASIRLRNLASSLPSELVTYIIEIAASTATSNTHKLRFLLLSRSYHALLSPLIYSTIALTSSQPIHAFSSLVRTNAKVARHVRRLWIGPDTSSSDLITALSPPTYNEAGYITDMREKIHVSVRHILRCCRKLLDVALAGELLSIHTAHSYGSACQPVRLTSINPHSFVSGFSAPIFRKVKVLRIVDTNLAFEEADEIRTLADLEWLIWSAPKDYGDIIRDSNVLRRLLQRPRRHFEASSDDAPAAQRDDQAQGSTPASAPAPQRSQVDQLWTELAALELSEGLAPARPSKNDKFRRLTIQTARNRAADLGRLLADSVPLYNRSAGGSSCEDADNNVTMGGLTGGLDATFEDLEREWDPVLNVPTIHAIELAGVVLDEWDALRDLINNAGGQYSNLSMWDVGEEEGAAVDAGNALRRQRRVWENFSQIGLPTRTVSTVT